MEAFSARLNLNQSSQSTRHLAGSAHVSIIRRVYTEVPSRFRVIPETLSEGLKMGSCDLSIRHGLTLDDNHLSCQPDFRECINQSPLYSGVMPLKYSAEDFERMFVSKIAGIIDESPGLDHSKFARFVWPGERAPVEKWRRIRNQSKHGKPQKLTISEALKMVEFLQADFPSFSWDVAKEAEQEYRRAEKSDVPQSTELPPQKTG